MLAKKQMTLKRILKNQYKLKGYIRNAKLLLHLLEEYIQTHI